MTSQSFSFVARGTSTLKGSGSTTQDAASAAKQGLNEAMRTDENLKDQAASTTENIADSTKESAHDVANKAKQAAEEAWESAKETAQKSKEHVFSKTDEAK
uniref:Uncharacterized protein n=1 Tax=Chenopodium quinoa TaxID=63459 RepID=A0A803L4D4_CHEQI